MARNEWPGARSSVKHLSPRRQSGLFRLTMPGAATRRRKQTKQASPLTPEEIKQLKRRRPLWSKEAACAFELEGQMGAVESSDSAAFAGTVAWPKAKGRPSQINRAVAARVKAALAAAVKADPSLRIHKNAHQYVATQFVDMALPVPPVGQLNRAIIWPVNGTTKRRSRT
jgi:hypothetical protein